MKRFQLIFGLFACSLLGIYSCDEKVEVPQAVSDAFSAKYSGAKDIEWEVEDSGAFEVEFEINKKEMSAEFKSDGTWVSSETVISIADLPKPVADAIATRYPGYEVEEPELIELPNGDINYEVEVEKGDKELEAFFTASGEFIEEKAASDDDDKPSA